MSVEQLENRPNISLIWSYSARVMLMMFVLWIAVFLGVFARRKWVIPLSIVALVWTAVLLRLHMTDPLPLEF